MLEILPEIKNCIFCQAELVKHEEAPAVEVIQCRWCPNCTYKFVVLSNNITSAIFVRIDGFRIGNWYFADRNECIIDKIFSIEGVMYNSYNSGSVSNLTLQINEGRTRILELKEFINFNFFDLKEFERKLKVLLTFL